MAFPRDKLSRREKACVAFSALILIFGLLQLCLGILLALKERNRKCPQDKSILIGVYMIVSGISGLIGYCPRRSQNHCKKDRNHKVASTVFIVFCALVTATVIMDNNAIYCIARHIERHPEASSMAAILEIVEVLGMHIGHLLCAICIGLACPDLFTRNSGYSKKCDRLLNSSTKHKTSKQALHLPEARTHVQEAAGTGDKVTVVSLPETEGIVYAVPEEQYVIRRGEATYMAPTGNTHLTAFFPTYNRMQID